MMEKIEKLCRLHGDRPDNLDEGLEMELEDHNADALARMAVDDTN